MREQSFHAIDSIDNVGSGLAEQNEQDRILAIFKADVPPILNPVVHIGDIVEADGGSVVISDDQRLIFRGNFQLIGCFRRPASEEFESSPSGLIAFAL